MSNNNNFNDFGMQQAPIINRNNLETNFKGSQNSHFSYVQGRGFHVTTQIPNMRGAGLPNGYSLHDSVNDMFNDINK